MIFADDVNCLDSLFSEVVSCITGVAPKCGDAAAHESIAHFGIIEEARALTSE